MAQPPGYDRQSNFSDHSTNNPTDPQSGVNLDAEFNALKTTIDAVLVNLALLQRDDTELANRTVGQEQLKSGVAVGVDPATAWATATAYAVNDLVWQNGVLYICEEAHTSGTFATDLAASKWSVVFDLSAEVPAVANLFLGTSEEKTANYTLLEADNGKSFIADTTSGNVTLTLPEISALSNGNFCRYLIFKKVAANSMNLARTSTDTINGATSQAFTTQYSCVIVFPSHDQFEKRYVC